MNLFLLFFTLFVVVVYRIFWDWMVPWVHMSFLFVIVVIFTWLKKQVKAEGDEKDTRGIDNSAIRAALLFVMLVLIVAYKFFGSWLSPWVDFSSFGVVLSMALLLEKQEEAPEGRKGLKNLTVRLWLLIAAVIIMTGYTYFCP